MEVDNQDTMNLQGNGMGARNLKDRESRESTRVMLYPCVTSGRKYLTLFY